MAVALFICFFIALNFSLYFREIREIREQLHMLKF